MKRVLNYIAFFGLMLGATSCDDFLREEPKSEMNTQQYFSKPDHARAAVNYLYRTGVLGLYNANTAYAGHNMMMGGYISGLFDNEYAGQEVQVQYSQSLTHSSENITNVLDAYWDDCYRGVANANAAIKYLPTTPGLSDGERNLLMGQARYFRAWNYFTLVKFFGDVPLILTPYETLDDLYVSRTASKEVYETIVEDLKFAVEVLENKPFTENGFVVSKTAAEGLLAKVYLQMSGYPVEADRYAEAASVAKNIINGGLHALEQNGATPEESAYAKIRQTDFSNEFIYTKEFTNGIAEAGWMPTFSFPNMFISTGIVKYAICINTYAPSDEMMNMYDAERDLRVQNQQFFASSYTYENPTTEQMETVEFDRTSSWFYFDPTALFETGMAEKDLSIMRYSEVLLIAAEAIAQKEGVTAEAVNYLAQVRARAYQEEVAVIEAELVGLSKEKFLEEVLIERFRELVPEMVLWDDIQRTRLFPESAVNGEVVLKNVIGAKNSKGAIFNENHLLWPISQNELQRNPKLTQNAGF